MSVEFYKESDTDEVAAARSSQAHALLLEFMDGYRRFVATQGKSKVDVLAVAGALTEFTASFLATAPLSPARRDEIYQLIGEAVSHRMQCLTETPEQ